MFICKTWGGGGGGGGEGGRGVWGDSWSPFLGTKES